MFASYSKIKAKDGSKFYAPKVVYFEQVVHLKGAKKTATLALEYASRFIQKWKQLHGEEKKIPSNQG